MSPRFIGLQKLVILASVYVAFANDVIEIGTILARPESYHLRLVTIQGVVRGLQPLEPYPNLGVLCYGAYTFTLEDGTGSLEVAVLGACGRQGLKSPEVFDGDQVVVQAHIQAPGYYTGEGLPPSGEVRKKARALAFKLWRARE